MGRSEQHLFDELARAEREGRAPLAHRMRPRSLDEIVGQEHLLGAHGPLRALIEADALTSALFAGPAGTGKTTVARLVATSGASAFVQLSAVTAGVKEVRSALEEARERLGTLGVGTVLFIDEIHRFSRTQQDALLPGVEDGTVVLIGATTENPYFALNSPLLSRLTIYRFTPLSRRDLASITARAAKRTEVTLDDDALDAIVDLAEGDARAALTVLEVAAAIAGRDEARAPVQVDRALVAAVAERRLRGDADAHYDVVSAFIKSIRGSDPDAGLYWLARLLSQGEDPRFVARRLVILASEDVGNADPMGLVVATAAAAALDRVGLPEARLNLAQAVTYLAMAPKSNAVTEAIGAAEADVRDRPAGAVPAALRDASYSGARALGHGVGYVYPHGEPGGWVDATYLPSELAGRRYYAPQRGREREMMDALDAVREEATSRADGVERRESAPE